MKIVSYSETCVTHKVIKADERWFDNHPKRNWRIRRFVAGEDGGLHDPPAPGITPLTIVERLASGAKMRRFMALSHVSRADLRALSNDEAIKHLFIAWSLSTPDAFAMGDVLPDTLIAARIRELRKTTGLGGDELADQIGRMVCPFSVEFAEIVMAEARP